MSTATTIEIASRRCDEHIAWYSKSGTQMRSCHYAAQVSVIVFTASVPILALIASDPSFAERTGLATWLLHSNIPQACLAGLAAVLVSLANLFQWHKKWLARSFTCEILKSERAKFQSRAGELYATAKTDEDAARRFLLRVEQIAAEELASWKSLQSSSTHE